MKPIIAVPYFPGSNGDYDAINRIKEFGMEPLPLYFHIGNEERLEENALLLENSDGAVLPGGFPYEDRIDFGVIPAKIQPFSKAIRALVDKGRPVIAFCSGNQVAQAMSLAFPEGSPYRVQMLPNICDRDGELITHGFLDKIVYTKLVSEPSRTAFTRFWRRGQAIPEIMDHGGGRFWADQQTLDFILKNGMVVTQYCDKNGQVTDNYPVNPNGSMLNIESITNIRGNLKIGMLHNERKLNALERSKANLVFESMRHFIEDGCPNLIETKRAQNNPNNKRDFIPYNQKDFSYLSRQMDPSRTIDIYVKMLTDDNERMTAQLFLGDVDLERRRLIRLELQEGLRSKETMQRVVLEIAKMDFFDGIMLKKDLPTVYASDIGVFSYEVVDRTGGKVVREFRKQGSVVKGFQSTYEQVSLPNPHGYVLQRKLHENQYLREVVTNVHVGRTWFFQDKNSKKRAINELLG